MVEPSSNEDGQQGPEPKPAMQPPPTTTGPESNSHLPSQQHTPPVCSTPISSKSTSVLTISLPPHSLTPINGQNQRKTEQSESNQSGSQLNNGSVSKKRTIQEVIVLSNDDEEDTPVKKQKIDQLQRSGCSAAMSKRPLTVFGMNAEPSFDNSATHDHSLKRTSDDIVQSDDDEISAKKQKIDSNGQEGALEAQPSNEPEITILNDSNNFSIIDQIQPQVVKEEIVTPLPVKRQKTNSKPLGIASASKSAIRRKIKKSMLLRKKTPKLKRSKKAQQSFMTPRDNVAVKDNIDTPAATSNASKQKTQREQPPSFQNFKCFYTRLIKCPMNGCNETFHSNEFYYRHRYRVHKSWNHQCMAEGCDDSFITFAELNIHSKRMHGNIDYWVCFKCPNGPAFESNFLLHHHWQEHHLEGVYVCVACKFKDHYRNRVIEHFEQEHRGTRKRGIKRKRAHYMARMMGGGNSMRQHEQNQFYRGPPPEVWQPNCYPDYNQAPFQNNELDVEPYVPESMPPHKRSRKDPQRSFESRFEPHRCQSRQEMFQQDCDYRNVYADTSSEMDFHGPFQQSPPPPPMQRGMKRKEYDGPHWEQHNSSYGYPSFSSNGDHSFNSSYGMQPSPHYVPSHQSSQQFDYGFVPQPPPPPQPQHMPPPQYGDYSHQYEPTNIPGPFFESSNINYNSFHRSF